MKPRYSLLAIGLLVATMANAQQRARVNVPDPDIGIATLQSRARAQIAAADQVRAFHGFRFTDRLPESGITFRHHIVEDSGKSYKAVHYDHGNALAIADVDGDGLLDLYFVSQIGSNELWRNLGSGRFENITESAGVGLADRIGVAASFGDIDNDGDPDLFVTTVKMGNALYENDGTGVFRDITQSAGLGHVGHSSGSVLFDYDGDGLLDLFVTNVGVYTTDEKGPGGYYIGLEDAFSGHLLPERSEQSILYHNLGGNRFQDASHEVGLVDTSWSGDASMVDFNGDAYPDLYVLNMQGDDHYYENQEGRTFTVRTASLFPKTPWGAMGIKSFDFNNDGRLDLLLTDMHSDMSKSVRPDKEFEKPQFDAPGQFFQDPSNNLLGNAFYRNDGDGHFSEISDQVGLENYWPWGVSVGDINADGYQDVFIASSMNYPFRYAINSMMLNEQGEHFAQSEFILGIEPRRDGKVRTEWFDLDCSGADAGHERCKGQTGPITVMATVGSRTSAIVDIDQDGDLDIITGDFNSEPQMLISDLTEHRAPHWISVVLQGTFSNRDGLGAHVTVEAGGRSFTQYNDGKSGYLSQSVMPLYFGLGEATQVDRITVLWPSGAEQVIEGPIDGGRLIRIEEE